jgi:hypothetical protein
LKDTNDKKKFQPEDEKKEHKHRRSQEQKAKEHKFTSEKGAF